MANPLSSLPDSAGPPRVLTAAPAGLPVEVRLSYAKYLLITRMREVVLLVIVGGGMLAGAIAFLFFAPDDTEHRVLIGLASLALALFLLVALPLSAKRQLKDGFSVGADRTGVYLRPHMDKVRVVFIPWEGVESIRIGRWMGPQLAVKPHDTLIEGQFALVGKGNVESRAGTAIAQGRRVARLGTNIHAPIPGIDKAELLNNLRYQAAGKAPIQ
jgi:hypothetical protein